MITVMVGLNVGNKKALIISYYILKKKKETCMSSQKEEEELSIFRQKNIKNGVHIYII